MTLDIKLCPPEHETVCAKTVPPTGSGQQGWSPLSSATAPCAILPPPSFTQHLFEESLHLVGHTLCFPTARTNGFTSVNCSTTTCCHATEIPAILKSFYCLSQTSVHCLNGKATLFGVSTAANDSGMHQSSVTCLLDLIFSFQE